MLYNNMVVVISGHVVYDCLCCLCFDVVEVKMVNQVFSNFDISIKGVRYLTMN